MQSIFRDVTIREARDGDWPIWRELRLRALGDSPDAFGETFAGVQTKTEVEWRSSTAARPDAIRLLAERDGVPVGMCVAVISEDARHGNVYAMWVAPEARGSGAGRG